MKRAAVLLWCVFLLAPPAAAQVPSPETFFGFRMGADRQLASWDQIQKYFATVAAASNRVRLVPVGPTTEGRTMIAAVVSAPENIARLSDIKTVNRRLSDPRTLTSDEAERLVSQQRAVVVIGASIHATEIGATQAANELLHRLATAVDADTTDLLRQVVVILIPSLNPDGHTLVVDWYNRQKGTPWEGGPMPWLYHRYVGHDINRDAFMLNMVENRSLARFFYREWHPHVFLTQHQMGPRGPRMFVPPNYDPIDPNYDPLIWRTTGLLGSAMALALEQDGHSGVVQNAIYDYYWPGYEDSAPLGHNTVTLLSEVASVRVATPLTIAPGELQGNPRGLPEYRQQINFPNPWPGGPWHLRDIVNYELSAAWGVLQGVARYREEIVRNFYTMGRHAVQAGERDAPFAFVIPPDQHDPVAARKLVDLLTQSAVEVQRATAPFKAGDTTYPAGTQLVLMSQPYRPYAKTLLERQNYPARRSAPDAPPERPYDVTGWTLPYQMGVDVRQVDRPFELPPMVQAEQGTITPGRVAGERRPDAWLVTAPGNTGVLAINRLLEAGLAVSWLTAPEQAQGATYPSGSLLVRGRDGAAVGRIVGELGLAATGIRGRLPGGALPLRRPRVALYKPWVENIDEGWTRWILEQYEFAYTTITDQDVRRGDLRARFDAIVLPDSPPDRLLNGHPEGAVPPEYVGGLGEKGAESLRVFVEAGGTLVCLDSAGQLATTLMTLPVKDAAQGNPDVFCPGSILRIEFDTSHPLAYGMADEAGGFFSYSSAYELRGGALTDGHGGPLTFPSATAYAHYATSNLLMSGWLEGESVLAGRAAAVEARVGSGRVVLLGFRVQHRAQSLATFRLLFNALYVSRAG